MRFNSYFIELTHRETDFTGNLMIQDNPAHTNFKKIGDDLFIAYFKNQVELKFLEKIEFKKKNSPSVTILFPLISKYNKRKLTRIAKILKHPETREKNSILFDFLTVEKFLKVGELLDFFSNSKEETIELLIRQELEKKIKIIDFQNLFITSYENFLDYQAELNTIFSNYLVNRDKTIKLTDLENKLKLPSSSIFFKYLLCCLNDNFSFRIIQDKIAFRETILSGKEKEAIKKIEELLEKNKLPIFTVEELQKSTDLNHKEVYDSLWHLLEKEEIVQLSKKYFILNEDLNKLINKLKKYKRNQGEMIDINTFREMTSFSRKYIIALFEYFDSRHLTMRVENRRKILVSV